MGTILDNITGQYMLCDDVTQESKHAKPSGERVEKDQLQILSSQMCQF